MVGTESDQRKPIYKKVLIENCVHYCAFRYGGNGFNPYEDYLVSLCNGMSVDSARKRFVDFLQHYRPTHLGEALGLQTKLSKSYPLWALPWIDVPRHLFDKRGAWFQDPNDCPDILTHFSEVGIPEARIEEEFAWLERALESIGRAGYRPGNEHSYVCSSTLRRLDGVESHLLIDGNHRVSAMWALGEKEVLISEPPENVVAEVDIEKWPGVRSGFYGREDALRIFDAYFLGNRLPRTTEQPAKILHREDKMANPENGLYDGFYKYDAVVAKSYERDRVDEVHWRLEDKFIKKYLKNKSIDRLLDLPVGTGRFIKHYNRVQCLVGIDISEDMLREARSKIDLRPPSTLTTLKKGDVANLEYPSDEFEVTIVCRLFHLLPPEVLGSAIAELCRVTKQEIVAQSYGEGDLSHGKGGGHYLRRLRVLSSSLMAQFREKLSSIESKDPKNRPWSHIQSYSHSQSAIDSMFLLGNFRIKQSVMLDSYEGSEVRMTVYEKASPA